MRVLQIKSRNVGNVYNLPIIQIYTKQDNVFCKKLKDGKIYVSETRK